MCAKRAAWCKYTLRFNFTARTSREEMTEKDTYFIKVWDSDSPDVAGIGECALFRRLSAEDRFGDYEQKLNELCRGINNGQEVDIAHYSSLRMGLETAQLDLRNGGRGVIVPGPWADGVGAITINALVWMGSADEMTRRISEKLASGCSCLKMKIGGISFDDELMLLDRIRREFPPEKLEVRLDANGAFKADGAMARLRELANFSIHSIEQPVMAGQWDVMKKLCEESPIPIALDEELIGLDDIADKRRMLTSIGPAYIVLKPSLCGGLSGAGEWISLAEETHTGWWVTSALESNVGLNAIAQWTASLKPVMAQGLGTGTLYTNNIESPLRLNGDKLSLDPNGRWQMPALKWIEP